MSVGTKHSYLSALRTRAVFLLQPPAARAALVSLGLATAFLLRAIQVRHFWGFPNAEAGAVARAIASGRGFSDAFYPGEGATAHLMPITPAIAAATYYVFGTGVIGEYSRQLLAFTITVSCYFIAGACCLVAGAARKAVIGAIAFLLFVPVYAFTELVRWQVWDGGLATLFALLTLLMLSWAELQRKQIPALLYGSGIAATFITNPVLGVAIGLAGFLFIVRNSRGIALVSRLLICAACVLVVTAPWAIRNELNFGRFIPTRDNAGLELAIANYPGAVSAVDPEGAFHARMKEIHPSENPAVERRMAAMGGEAAYDDFLGKQTLSWMELHPADVLRLWADHVSAAVFPRPSAFRSSHIFSVVPERVLWCDLVSGLALVSLAVAAFRRDRRYTYIEVFLGAVVFLGMPFHPVLRYCWPMYPLLACVAADLIWRGGRLVGTLRPSASLSLARWDASTS